MLLSKIEVLFFVSLGLWLWFLFQLWSERLSVTQHHKVVSWWNTEFNRYFLYYFPTSSWLYYEMKVLKVLTLSFERFKLLDEGLAMGKALESNYRVLWLCLQGLRKVISDREHEPLASNFDFFWGTRLSWRSVKGDSRKDEIGRRVFRTNKIWVAYKYCDRKVKKSHRRQDSLIERRAHQRTSIKTSKADKSTSQT